MKLFDKYFTSPSPSVESYIISPKSNYQIMACTKFCRTTGLPNGSISKDAH